MKFINFIMPKNILSNNILKNVLYLVTLALIVSYIINKQSLALISLIVIAGIIYLISKNVVIALLISIIITNLLLAMNYIKESNVIEGSSPMIVNNYTPEHARRLRLRALAARQAHDAAIARGATPTQAQAAGITAARRIV